MSKDIKVEKASETPEVRKTYNGWSNYETWLVKLWIDNSEGSYDYWREEARRAYENVEQDGTFTKIEHAAVDLEKTLKSWHKEIAEYSGVPTTGFVADLFNAAMSEVNWYEIATSLIEENLGEG